MAPVESKPPELFDKVWNFDVAENVISIGWRDLGDISTMPQEKLAEAISTTYPDKPSQTKSLYRNMLWAFYNEIKPGDYLIARRGRKTLAGVGKVTDTATYAPARNPYVGHLGFLDVVWQDRPRDKTFPSIVFPMRTLVEFSEEDFHNIAEGNGPPLSPPESQPEIEDKSEFVLEKYLEDFIVVKGHPVSRS